MLCEVPVLLVLLIGSPITFADCLIGSPISSQSTASEGPQEGRPSACVRRLTGGPLQRGPHERAPSHSGNGGPQLLSHFGHRVSPISGYLNRSKMASPRLQHSLTLNLGRANRLLTGLVASESIVM